MSGTKHRTRSKTQRKQKTKRCFATIQEVQLCHAWKIRSGARPLLRWFGCGSPWISERVLAGKQHVLSVMGGFPSPGALTVEGWCNMRSLWLPWMGSSLWHSVCCYADFACSLSWIFTGGGAKPVKVKQRWGGQQQSEVAEEGRSAEQLLLQMIYLSFEN